MKPLTVAMSLWLSLASGACQSSNTSERPMNPAPAPQTQPQNSVFEFSLESIDGARVELSQYRGKVLLIVNVASRCGFTPQYAGLQQLHERYAARGLVVLGVPSNDFGAQEPGSNEEIQTFCSTEYGVTFPMFSKIVVKGSGQHPLFRWLTADGDSVSWNFNKFLIDKEGHLVEHFGARVKPLSKELLAAIEKQL